MLDAELVTLQIVETIVATASFFSSAVALLDHYKNRKHRRNLMNRQVAVLCSIDLVVAFFLAIGVAGTKNEGFCQFQGFILQWGFLGSVLWNAAMGNQIYRLIVKKKSEERLMRRLKVLAFGMAASSLLVAVILLGDGRIGDATLFCWIDRKPDYMRYLGFFWILVVCWIVSALNYMKISHSIKRHNTKPDSESHVSLAENQIRAKLRMFLIIFVCIWLVTFINYVAESIADKPVFVTALLQAFILPSQGLINSIYYGGLLNDDSMLWTILRMGDLGDKIMNVVGDAASAKSRRRSSLRHHKVWDKEVVNSPRSVSIFSTTFNQGEAVYSELGDFSTWIKPGHDVYAVGVQECMCLDEFRAGLFAHLGGPSEYTMFSTQIGSSNTRLGFHGFIALTVFIRTSDIQSGAIKLVESASRDVASGANLIVTTAANKGAVGLLFHIHDITIGFVTAHLPSDSKGKSKLPKRNGTAQDILRDLVLASDDLGCDVQLQHDYFIIMGDLNYRMNTPPSVTGLNILQMIAEAALIEKNALDGDPEWIKRKYALMNGPHSAAFPSQEEREKILQAEAAAAPSWDKVLALDELKDMMNLGEVYTGFFEPLPRFPPSYKRKKGFLQASCGDYSDITQVLQGFSHIGEELPQPAAPAVPELEAAEPVPETERVEPPQAAAATPSLSIVAEVDESDDKDENEARDTFQVAINGQADSSTEVKSFKPSPPPKAKPVRRASLLGFMGASNGAPTEEDPKTAQSPPTSNATATAKKRRTSVFNALRSAESLAASEAAAIASKEAKAKSKIRPPSYTDRILTHALPDRIDKLTVTSYGFCDDIRSSDHRPVCMTLQIQVNKLIAPLSNSIPSTAPARQHSGDNAIESPRSGFNQTGINVILVALEMSEVTVDIHANPGIGNPMLLGAAEGNAYLSNDMDNSDSSASADLHMSSGRFSLARSSMQSTRDLETGLDALAPAISNLEVAEITVIFPLPCKDPMSVQRKMFDYVRALNLTATSAALAKDGLMASMIRPASTVFPWAACSLGDLQVEGCVSPELGIHALIKLTNSDGEDLGECVVTLSQLVSPDCLDHFVEAELPLSSGGQTRGLFKGRFKLRRIHVEEKPAGGSKRRSMLSFK